MPYSVKSKKSGKTYYLHKREKENKNGSVTALYFFAGEVKEGAIDELPADRVVSENERTGLPFLKKKG